MPVRRPAVRQPSARPPATAVARALAAPAAPRWAALAVLALGALLAGTARGQEAAAEGAAPAEAASGETVVSHGYNFFGELKYPGEFERLDYVNPDAPKGGEISTAVVSTFDSFNNYTLDGNAAAFSTIGHESMMVSTADDITSLYCLLCETLEYPEDLAWVTFTLREGITFADGSPMTAQDVAFTFDRFMTDGLESYRAVMEGQIASVEVLDDRRVRFTFTPEAPVRERIGLAGTTPVFSQAWFESTGVSLADALDEPILGSGAYEVDMEATEVGRRVVARLRDDYWGADLPLNVGQNNFETLRIEYFTDPTAALEAFKAGEYTFRNENSSLQWATAYEAFPALQAGHVIKTELPNGNLGLAQSLAFNLRRPQFQDPLVREALTLMFNFEWSNATLFYDLYARVDSFWPNSELAATGTPSPEEVAILQPLVDEGLLPASILTDEAVQPPVSSVDSQTDRRALRAASALLDEAGWEVGDDGMRRKDGQTLDVAILESDPAFDRIFLPFVENLTALGVNASIDRVDPAQETQRRDESDFDVANLSIAMTLEPGIGLRQWFGTEGAAESNRNLMGLADPAVDRLIDGVVAAQTKEELTVAVRALDRVLRSMRFAVPEWYKANYTVAFYDQYGYPDPLPPYDLGFQSFWWYDAEKGEALREAGVLR